MHLHRCHVYVVFFAIVFEIEFTLYCELAVKFVVTKGVRVKDEANKTEDKIF